MSDWLSPEELAQAAQVPLADVRAAIDARALHAVTTHPTSGGRWRVHVRDGDTWLRSVDPAWPVDGLRSALRSGAQDPASPGIDES
jgi:hypothetical protein